MTSFDFALPQIVSVFSPLLGETVDLVILGVGVVLAAVAGFLLLVSRLGQGRKHPPNMSLPTGKVAADGRPIPPRGSASPLKHAPLGPRPLPVKSKAPTERFQAERAGAGDTATAPTPSIVSPGVTSPGSNQVSQDNFESPTMGGWDDEIEVVESDTQVVRMNVQLNEQIRELQMSLEASQLELTHISEERNQAHFLAAREEETSRQLSEDLEALRQHCETLTLRQQETIANIDALQQQLAAADQELTQTRHDLGIALQASEQVASIDVHSLREEAIHEATKQYQSTLDELRMLLGQHEATEASLHREREDLANQVAQLQHELTKRPSQHVTEALPADLAAQQLAADQLVSEQLDAERLAAQRLVAEHAGQLDSLRNELQIVLADLSLANESVSQLHQNLSQRDAQIMELRRQYTQLESQERELREQYASQMARDDAAFVPAIQHADVASELEQAHLELAKLHEAHQRDIAAAVTQQESLRREIVDLQQSLEDAHQTQQSLVQSHQQLAGDKESLRSQLSAAHTELHHAMQQVELRQPSAELQAERDLAVEQAARLQRELNELRIQADERAAELQSRLDDVVANSIDAAEHSQLAVAHEALLVERESLAARHTELQAELTAVANQLQIQQEMAISEQDRAAAKQELEMLRADLADLHGSIAEKEELAQKEIDGLRLQATNLKKELEDAQRAVRDAVEQSELSAQVAKQHRQQAELVEAELAEFEQLERQRAELELAEFERLGEQRAEVERAELERLEAERRAAEQARIQQLEQLRQEAEREVTSLRQALDLVKQEHTSLQIQMEELTSQLEVAWHTVPESAAEQLSQIDVMQEERQQFEERCGQLETELNEIHSNHQEIVDRLGAAQEEVNAKAAEMKRMRERLHVAEQAAADAASLQDAHAELLESLQRLQHEYDSTQHRLEQTQRDQIELKQQLACMLDLEESWQRERTELFRQLGLDESGTAVTYHEPNIVSIGSLIDRTTTDITDSGASQSSETPTADLALAMEAVSELQARLDEATEKAGLAQRQVNEIDKERNRVQAALQQKEEAIVHLKAELQEMESVRRLAESEQRNETQRLRVAHDQAVEVAAQASTTIADLMAQQVELQHRADSTVAEVAQLQSDNAEYRRSVAELHALANELEELKLERERDQKNARQRLQEATTANAELRQEIERLKATEKHAMEQLATAEQRQVDTTAIEILKQSNDTLAEQIKSLEQELLTERRQRELADQKLTALAEELASTPSDLKEARALAQESKKLQAASEKQQRKLSEQEQKLQELAAKLSKSRSEVASLTSELLEHQAVVRSLGGNLRPAADASSNGTLPSSTGRHHGAKGDSAAEDENKGVRSSRTVPQKSQRATGRKSQRATAPDNPPAKPRSQSRRDPVLGNVFPERPAQVDDLKQILGIGRVIEKKLHAIGIYQFRQISSWTDAAIRQIDEQLALGGRIVRDQWVEQARKLG